VVGPKISPAHLLWIYAGVETSTELTLATSSVRADAKRRH
jgi:hypothetical protein